MSETTVPGIKAVHAIITPRCRANRTVTGAFHEAVIRIEREYLACQIDANADAEFHLVLTVQRAEEGKSPRHAS